MILFYILFLLFSLSNASLFRIEDESEEDQYFPNRWIEMPLDHFNLFDNRTFEMRFFEWDKHFVEGGPIFIEIGGESTADTNWLLFGPLTPIAKDHNGTLILTEHRFYGKTLPFSTNFTTENLHFLQMEQALEDLAFFIDKFKNSDPKYKNSPVVLHGCSYPGMMATWMRLRFPHLVDISYASSAPLGVGLDYPEYYQIVSDVYANVSVSCIGDIREGFNRTAHLMKTATGRKRVRDALKGWDCGNPSKMNSFEILNIMMSVLNVQNDELQYEEVSCLALSMDTDDTSPFQRLANLIVLKSKNTKMCVRRGDDSVDDEDEDDDGMLKTEDERNSMSWSYQLCTEQGTFLTLNRSNSRNPFAMDATVEESVERCVLEFGEIVTEQVLRNGVERVTRRYGGKRPKVTKLVTVQGIKDPWRDLASLEDYTPEAPVLLAEGSHCVDVYPSKDSDPPSLVAVRAKVREYIEKWLSELEN